MLKPSWPEFRTGAIDILPVIVAAVPIGVLWGTLAAGKGLAPFEAGLISISVFAGAAQYVAIELWREPVPWIFQTVTVFIVNIRHVMMEHRSAAIWEKFPTAGAPHSCTSWPMKTGRFRNGGRSPGR